ncbi:pyridoxamine 5-phosphate oxidase [Acetobacterium fimetarium]|uniref:Pyridoxamine 5-phosphate oxidase n=1 Tax=Acetobacterium fimetarium TaxID=52691 RepID=A0ABR6WXE7_9FIRM|nr:pyridoxamine 5'-phosphate oxidase family protein [Acetobacterium fimetarium]MBC3805309.1 pyridoxamine 5-phosphate oxidase [Acetobacterium fimetarium]
MEEVLSFLQENSPFYLASVDGTTPKVRPLGFCMGVDGKIYFGIGTFKPSYAQLTANAAVEISTTSKTMEWIRLRGTAVFDESAAVTAKAFEVMPNLKAMYNEETGRTLGLFYLKDAVAEIADMKGGFKEIKF